MLTNYISFDHHVPEKNDIKFFDIIHIYTYTRIIYDFLKTNISSKSSCSNYFFDHYVPEKTDLNFLTYR